MLAAENSDAKAHDCHLLDPLGALTSNEPSALAQPFFQSGGWEGLMHDTVIRGGTIVDGSGKPGFTGDVAIEGDRIAAVGGKLGPAKRDVDASGMLVTPGWVDAHTHYD